MGLSRRELIGASAGAAALAVPMSALSAGGLAAAGGTSAAGGNSAADAELADDVEYDIEGAVMFCVRDVRTGEASILHGTEEVIVRDRQLVNRILRAANVRRAV